MTRYRNESVSSFSLDTEKCALEPERPMVFFDDYDKKFLMKYHKSSASHWMVLFMCSSLLRSIEFPSIGPGGPSGETGKSLEMLLLERTKALQQAETAALKAAADLQGNAWQ